MRAQNLIPDFFGDGVHVLVAAPREIDEQDLSFGKVGASFAAWATACADSRAGMMPS